MFNFKAYRFRKLNMKLLVSIVVLTVLGVLLLKSATMQTDNTAIMNRQFMGLAVSVLIVVLFALIDFHWLMKFYWVFYILVLAFLAATWFFGVEWNNAKRWIELPVLGQIQPSEFCKILLILFFSMFFHKNSERINKPWLILITLVLLAAPIFLVMEQPDLSTTVVMLICFIFILYAAKISYKWIIAAAVLMVPALGFLIYLSQQDDSTVLRSYQLTRILSWLNPEKYSSDTIYQQRNSVMAIGSGQLFGKGLFNNSVDSVKNGNFLSEADTDFIFAVVGEELGFIGCLIILLLFLIIVIECLAISFKTKELYGRLICVGMASLIAFQSFVNIGVATWLLPNTGIPLPFISAGLSSRLSFSIGIGILLNISMQRSDEIQGGT